MFLWMWGFLRAKVPFVPVPNSILDDVKNILEIKDGSVVYDLGSGDGRILFYLSKAEPKARYIGIENSLFPVMLSRAVGWWHKRRNTKVDILNKDFNKHDLSDATHIFMYLYPNVMDDILPKLDRELKPGTKLVSVTFKFTSRKPIAEIDLNRHKHLLARKMYVYEF